MPVRSVTHGRTTSYGHATTLLLIVLALGASAARAQVRVIDPNGLYPAGTRLSSPLTGIGFRLPDGFRAEWDRALGALVAQSHVGAFGAVWGWADGTTEEVAAEIGTRLDAQGIALEARAGSEIDPSGMSGVFDATTSQGRGVLHLSIRLGPSGGVVAIAGLGPTEAEPSAAAFVDQVLASLEWTEPRAALWRQRVAGNVLTREAGAAPVTRAGAAILALCRPGQYAFEASSGPASDRHEGDWWLVADLAGTSALVLEATDGRSLQWTVEASGDGFLIDGDRYGISGPC